MPTMDEYRRIARYMESVIHFVQDEDVSKSNVIYALGQLDSAINDHSLHSCDALWVWWLQFECFTFANESKPGRAKWQDSF